MPYDGSGIFTQIYNWVTDKANSVLVTASRFQATYDDMAAAFTNCLTRDGQSPALANIPMGGFRITDLADGVAATDAATVGQIPLVGQNVYTSRVTRGSSNQTIATGTTAVAIYNTVVADPFAEWNTATGVFTAVASGVYQMSAVVLMKVVTGGATLFITPIIATAGQTRIQYTPTQFNNQYQSFIVVFQRNMQAADTAYLQISNNTTGNVTLELGAEIQMTRIGNI